MLRSRSVRAIGQGVLLALFLAFSYAAVRFLLDTLGSRGWGPGALFALLLVAGALSLVWRATLDFRKAVRRLRG